MTSGSCHGQPKSGIKLDLKKLKLKGLTTAFKLNIQEKGCLNMSVKDIKSTGRSKKIRDYDSDSEINSYRFNTKENYRSNDHSNVSGFYMKVPVLDKNYMTKQSNLPSDTKSSARVQPDWTYHIPFIHDDQDSEEECE